MKKFWMVLLAITLLSGCTSSTPYGRCIGLNQDEDPSLRYEISARNIIVGVFFFQMIAPPVIVALDEYKCPAGPKGGVK